MSQQSQPMCVSCGQFHVRPVVVDWTVDVPHDGKTHTIIAHGVPAARCEACHDLTFGLEAQPVVRAAMRKHLGLLAPGVIRANRKKLGLKQSELAELMGCSSEWLSRLEKDRLIQSRVHDRFLRLFFAHSIVRSDLSSIARGDSTVGIDVVLPNAAVLGLASPVFSSPYRRCKRTTGIAAPSLRFPSIKEASFGGYTAPSSSELLERKVA